MESTAQLSNSHDQATLAQGEPRDPAEAVLEFGHGHRCVVVVFGGPVFDGVERDELGGGRRGDSEEAAVRPGETRAGSAEVGDIEIAVAAYGHRFGQGDLGQSVDLWIGGTGEADAGQAAQAVVAGAAGRAAGDPPAGG
jgi:hypothetical protein